MFAQSNDNANRMSQDELNEGLGMRLKEWGCCVVQAVQSSMSACETRCEALHGWGRAAELSCCIAVVPKQLLQTQTNELRIFLCRN